MVNVDIKNGFRRTVLALSAVAMTISVVTTTVTAASTDFNGMKLTQRAPEMTSDIMDSSAALCYQTFAVSNNNNSNPLFKYLYLPDYPAEFNYNVTAVNPATNKPIDTTYNGIRLNYGESAIVTETAKNSNDYFIDSTGTRVSKVTYQIQTPAVTANCTTPAPVCTSVPKFTAKVGDSITYDLDANCKSSANPSEPLTYINLKSKTQGTPLYREYEQSGGRVTDDGYTFEDFFGKAEFVTLANGHKGVKYTVDKQYTYGNTEVGVTFNAVNKDGKGATGNAYGFSIWIANDGNPNTPNYAPGVKASVGNQSASNQTSSAKATMATNNVDTAPTTYKLYSLNADGKVGASSDHTVTVYTSKAEKDKLIDIEIYNATGTRVKQMFYDHKDLALGNNTFNINWTPTEAGTYTVKAGLFSSDWQKNYAWEDKLASVKVEVASTTATAPVASTATAAKSAQTNTVSQSYEINSSTLSDGATVSGLTVFKATLTNKSVTDYKMYWQVDNGNLVEMATADSNHKEAYVDFTGWKWSATGKYKITFVAKDLSGGTVAKKDMTVTVK